MGSPFLDAFLAYWRKKIKSDADKKKPTVEKPDRTQRFDFGSHLSDLLGYIFLGSIESEESMGTPKFSTRAFQDRSPGSSSVLDQYSYLWVYDAPCNAPSTKHNWKLRDGAGNPLVDKLSTWTNFGFTIPAGAEIIGLIVTLQASLAEASHGSYEDDCFDSGTVIIKTPGDTAFGNHINVRLIPPGAFGKNLAMADGQQVHGAEEDMWPVGGGDLWGASPEVINDPAFGIEMTASPGTNIVDAKTPTAGTPPTAIPSEDLDYLVTNVRVYYET